jgi:hypothetical protein
LGKFKPFFAAKADLKAFLSLPTKSEPEQRITVVYCISSTPMKSKKPIPIRQEKSKIQQNQKIFLIP